MTLLPRHWREIKSAEGEVLYWRRDHSGYEVLPAHGQFVACLDNTSLGMHPTRDHAILACREHLHANQQISTQPQEFQR